jgi:hypothetical protein
MPVKHKRAALSEEERAERRRADREYARHAVGRLRSSQGWQRWLATRRHFHSYSLGNQLLIAMVRPTATRVAGFRSWLELGYAVRKRPEDVEEGQWAIRIWAPCPPSRKQIDRWQKAGADPEDRPRTYFRLVPVFDRLSRVRSGDVADARVGLRFPAGISLLVCAPGFMREGTGFRLARASRRYPANRRVISRRECRRRVPKPGS